MPDTYRKLFEDMLAHIDVLDHDPFVDRLRALDEAGPYGYVVGVDHMGNGVFDRLDGTIEDSRDAAVEMVPEPGCRGKNQWRIIPLYAGTPEEVDGD